VADEHENGNGSGSRSGPLQVEPVSRRGFLLRFGIGLNVIAASCIAIPVVGYILSAVVKRKAEQAWIPLGEVAHFPSGQTRLATYRNPFTTPWDGETASIPCWVRHTPDGEFQVFAINCAHLGCPVRWFAESRLFMCPCHGGVYYEDGSVASGPPPRGLYEYEYRIATGQLQVRGGRTPSLAESV
jgi:Rieske Fe-S protein